MKMSNWVRVLPSKVIFALQMYEISPSLARDKGENKTSVRKDHRTTCSPACLQVCNKRHNNEPPFNIIQGVWGFILGIPLSNLIKPR